jgi:general secretion pathway protein N
MTRARAIVLFVAVFVGTLVLTFPLGAALSWFGGDKAGVSARAARGDVWTGQLFDARMGPIAIGFARVGLKPLPLLTGRVEWGADTTIGFGRMFRDIQSNGVTGVSAKLPVGPVFAPVPVETIELVETSVAFKGDACYRAAGRVRVVFAGQIAGLSLASGLSGVARCEGRDLLIPLVSQSAMERLTLRITGSGQWTGVLAVKADDAALATKLTASGFEAVASEYVLRLSGTV